MLLIAVIYKYVECKIKDIELFLLKTIIVEHNNNRDTSSCTVGSIIIYIHVYMYSCCANNITVGNRSVIFTFI